MALKGGAKVLFILIENGIALAVFILSWWLVGLGFPELHHWYWFILWFVVTFGAIRSYFSFHWDLRKAEKYSASFRKLVIGTSLFWFVTQSAWVLLCPIWIAVGVGRWLSPENEMIWSLLSWVALIFPLPFTFLGSYFAESWKIYRQEIRSRRVPKELDGLKIAHLTDLHLLFSQDVDMLKKQLQKVAEEKPDLLLFTGDFADSHERIHEAVHAFAERKEDFPLGIWFTLGNHEYIRGEEPFIRAYRKAGIPLLRNEGTEIVYKDTSFYLAGIDYPFSTGKGPSFGAGSENQARMDIEKAVAQRPKGMFTILGTHHPVAFDPAFEQDVDVSLAGHTHGYQLGIGRISLIPFIRYTWGLYGDEKRGYGYVNGGLGDWFPIRIGVPREAVMITLCSID